MSCPYKLIVWGDALIPVPIEYKWLAVDSTGIWWVFVTEPHCKDPNFWLTKDEHPVMQLMSVEVAERLGPPERGRSWRDQLYYIA